MTEVSCVLSLRCHQVLDCVLLIAHDQTSKRVLPVNLIASNATASASHLPSPPWQRRLLPTGNPDSSILPSHAEDPSPSPRRSRSCPTWLHLCLGQSLVDARHPLPCLHAVITPRPKWEMCELMCIELFLSHVCWQCSMLGSTCFLTLFQLHRCRIWVRHRDRWGFNS